MPPSRNSRTRPISNDSAPGSTAANEKSLETPWLALFSFTSKANIPMLITGTTCSFIAGAVSPINAYLTGRVFNGFSMYAGGKWDKEKLMSEEKKYIIYMVALAGGSWLFHSLQLMCWLTFGELQAKNSRDRLFHGLLQKEIEWFEMRKNGIGALLPRLQTQIRDLQLATAQPLGSLFALSSTAVLSIVQAFYRSWDLTLVTLATTPLIIVTMIWLGNRIQQLLGLQQAQLDEAQKVSTNALSAIDTVKCFNGQHIELKMYIQKTHLGARIYYRCVNAASMQMAFLVLLSVLMFIQGFYYGGILIGEGKKNASDVITTFLSAIGAFQAIQSFLPQIIVLEKGKIAGATLKRIMTEVQRGDITRQDDRLKEPGDCRGDIAVKNLSFAYPSQPNRPALNDVTMYIPNGDLIFVIGRSGSGKSTLGQLLMGFYTHSSGTITIDGNAVRALDVTWLRSNITLVEQQSLLFNDTIHQNIAFGKKGHSSATKVEVRNAAEFALLQHMISDLPEGFDTMVGYKGGALSGGQRQRMALARARLRDTPILILDESTSALDHISRALMMDAIRQWRQGKTTIIITHDISQILPDDYLYILESGKLVQEGFRQNLEIMKNTPFQDFLPEDQRAAKSPFDARKGSKFEMEETGNQFLDPHIGTGSEALFVDPLEAQLNVIDEKRASFVKVFAGQGTPLTAMRGFGTTGFRGTPLLGSALPQPPKSPTKARKQSPTIFEKGDFEIETLTREEDGKRWSQVLLDLVDTAGKFAVDMRSNSLRTPRTPRTPHTPWRHTILPNANQKLEVLNELESTEENEKVPVPESKRSTTESLTHIMATIWPNLEWPARVLLIMGLWGASVHAAGTPVFAFILSKLLQTYAVPGGDKHTALIYSMAILAVAATDAAHTYIFRFFLECAAQTWVDNIRSRAFQHILDQPKEFFDNEENSVSRLTDCLDRNAEEMRNLLGRFAPLGYIAALISLISFFWALSASWKMTLISLSVAPYIFGVTKAFSAISGKWESLSNESSESASAIFTETFTNIKTVRALTLESHFTDKYIAATNRALIVGFQRSFYTGFFYGVSDSAGAFATALIFYTGTWLVSSQGTDASSVIQVFVILMFAIQQVGDILQYIPQIGNAQDTASRLLRLSSLPKSSHEHQGDTRLHTIGDIVFDRLTFSYPSRPEQTILRNIGLHIRPGTSTAIVGGSGSGKSTIANLLLGLYNSTPSHQHTAIKSDPLTISHRPITQISTLSLRALIVPVSQTPTLFAATIAENITYGLAPTSPYAQSASVTAAARQVGLHEFIISLPEGYSTKVGDGGMGLSGGQAQRVALARALVRKPKVLILDEATSALDPESAALIRGTLESLVADKESGLTLIIITHSREMMEIADQVVVLEDGRVVETGGFQELATRKGPLANLLSGGQWDGEREDGVKDEGLEKWEKLRARDVNWSSRRATGRAMQDI